MSDSFDLSSDPSLNSPESAPLAELSELERALETLAGHLVWKMGKDEDSEALVIRVGYASSTPLFAHRSRLHALSDAEVQAAMQEHNYRVEWMED